MKVRPVPGIESIASLPAGVRIQPGLLQIEFFGTEDLLKHLYALAQAGMADYPGFQKICEGDSPLRTIRAKSSLRL